MRKSDTAVGERVPFNDLAIQWQEIAADAQGDFARVFASSAFSSGPFVEEFENDVAAYLSCPYAVGVNSGTSALHLAMLAADIGPGDEVLVPSHTFIATLWGALYAGARPVLCDVNYATGTIDMADAEHRLSPRTKAVIPVHLYGQPADMDAVQQFAQKHGLIVIEDASQAIGARWNGKAVGTLGLIGCYSFYPAKNLGAAGEAGLLTSSDAAIDRRLRSLRNHGQSERYIHDEVGYNYRMDGLQGVVLRRKLVRLPVWTERRRQLAQRYQAGLAGLPLDVPAIRNQDHVWHLFVVRTPHRDALRARLQGAGIETGMHYPVPLHRQPCLAHLEADAQTFQQSDRWADQGLSLPLFYGMKDAQVDRVVEVVRDFSKHA
jgi:dTDP-4-amino-4,6-dideoxygalactose transaminase